MDSNLLLISGMYRSGTTLLSRLLQGSEKVSCASDPIRPFFNAYSNKLKFQKDLNDTNLFNPFSDLFLENFNYLEKLLNSNFSEPIEFKYSKKINESVIEKSYPYSPLFSNKLRNSNLPKSINVWSELLIYFLEKLDATYKKKDSKILAFKEVWALEIALPLLNLFKNKIKIISVIREPADIFASSKANAGNYPLLYIARQWRKTMTISTFLINKYPKNIFELDYAELCTKPEETYKNLLSFLNIDNKEILKIPDPVDDYGNIFLKNSSHYFNNKFLIDRKSINKYSSILSKDEKQWIFYFTSIFDRCRFNSLCKKEINKIPLCDYPKRESESIAEWFRLHYPNYEYENFDKKLEDEKFRFENYKSILKIPNYFDNKTNILENIIMQK